MNNNTVEDDMTFTNKKFPFKWVANALVAIIFVTVDVITEIRITIWNIEHLHLIVLMICLLGFIYGVNNSIFKDD